MGQYEAVVVDYPAKKLAGTKVRTTIEKTNIDSPALWERFMPRLGEFPAGPSYGCCVMVNETDMDYWAAMETAAVPAGMECFELQAGRYVKCKAASLETLGEVYTYMYTEWEKSQNQYAIDLYSPCFELYQSDWMPEKPFEIYVPLKVKQ